MERVRQVIIAVEEAQGSNYRIRIGDFRLGVIIEDDIVTFVRCLHRSEIYRYFP